MAKEILGQFIPKDRQTFLLFTKCMHKKKMEGKSKSEWFDWTSLIRKKGTLLLVQDDFNRTLQNSVLDTHKDAILEYGFILNCSFFLYIRTQEWIESTQAVIRTVFGNSLLLGVTCLCWIVFLFIVIKMVADVYWKSKGYYKAMIQSSEFYWMYHW